MAAIVSTTGPALDSDRKYDPIRDFAPISLAGTTAYMLVLHPSLPARSVREFIALAKASPGRITYSTTGQGSPAHLGAELFQAMAQVKLVHVPYKGGAPAMLSLLQGETYVMVANFLTALPPVRSNRVQEFSILIITCLPRVVAECPFDPSSQIAMCPLLTACRT